MRRWSKSSYMKAISFCCHVVRLPVIFLTYSTNSLILSAKWLTNWLVEWESSHTAFFLWAEQQTVLQMYVARESCSQIVLLCAAMCRRYEWEECKLSGLFGAAAATSTAYATSRFTRTTWERRIWLKFICDWTWFLFLSLKVYRLRNVEWKTNFELWIMNDMEESGRTIFWGNILAHSWSN